METAKRIKKAKIKNWYWSAGQEFGWTFLYEPAGIGLNKDLFVDSDVIQISIKGEKYELDTQEGLAFIRENKSFKKIKSAKIGHVPKELLTKI